MIYSEEFSAELLIGGIYIYIHRFYTTFPTRDLRDRFFLIGTFWSAKHFLGVKVEGGPRNSNVVGPDLSNHHLANPNGSSK